MTKPAQ